MSLSPPTLDAARRRLRESFGFDDFRPGQEEILAAILAGEDVFAVMPTGAGKSLLYQLPAAMGLGLVLVVSPLISLMRDQLRMAQEGGAPAAALHSGQDEAEAQAAVAGVVSGRVKLLYAAPERLAGDGLKALLKRAPPRLFAVDEAHCLSHWGHEFRPDYARLGEFAQELRAPHILAVTATAGARTRDDIIAGLFPQPPRVFLRSFARPNLALAFAERRDALAQAYAVIDAHKGESGILYCNSRRGADAFAAALRARGVDALAYHAGMDAGARTAHQDAFTARAGVVMVATIAFGMGVDKKDVRFIVHVDAPTSVEAYYQEIGRAGRDGAPARTLCLFDARERAARLSGGESDAAAARRRAMAQLCAAPGCRSVALLAAFGETGARCGVCDNCRGGLFSLPRRAGALATLWRARFSARLAEAAPLAESEATADMETVETTAPEPVPPPALRADEDRLLRALEQARRDIARKRRVAPRQIAGDDFLLALARLRPASVAAPPFDAEAAPALSAAEAQSFLRALAQIRDG
jgi:ATP-dependent DNA helicase RecQ